MNREIEKLLFKRGADIIRFIDISNLPVRQTQGYAKAILFCVALSKDFIIAIRAGEKREQEFVDKEHETDTLADCHIKLLRDLPESVT